MEREFVPDVMDAISDMSNDLIGKEFIFNKKGKFERVDEIYLVDFLKDFVEDEFNNRWIELRAKRKPFSFVRAIYDELRYYERRADFNAEAFDAFLNSYRSKDRRESLDKRYKALNFRNAADRVKEKFDLED